MTRAPSVQVTTSGGETWHICPDKTKDLAQIIESLQKRLFDSHQTDASLKNTLQIQKNEIFPASLAEELERLSKLKLKGAITANEYETFKNEVLRRSKSAA